jgi:CCR4-NOT complex subunit CAF16
MGTRDECPSRAILDPLRTPAGKSTLLRILAGRHLPKPVTVTVTVAAPEEGDPSASTATTTTVLAHPTVQVLGLHAFHDTRLNFHRAYLDCDWGMRSVAFVGAAVPLMADIAVRNMMERLQSEYPDRRDELLDLLMIDLDWVSSAANLA